MMATVEVPPSEDLVDLYRSQYRSLVRLASLLLDDRGASEEVVQDAFIRVHQAWGRIADPAKRAAYLRSAVMNGARSRMRRRVVRRRLEPVGPPLTAASAEADAMLAEEHREVLDSLRVLPTRQRECLVLRYYLDLADAEIAATLGMSVGSVKTHVHRGMATLTRRLEGRA
jgi:RNA polymerase sigma-70 factor (sigma-E family)